jgi:hypothetical protein
LAINTWVCVCGVGQVAGLHRLAVDARLRGIGFQIVDCCLDRLFVRFSNFLLAEYFRLDADALRWRKCQIPAGAVFDGFFAGLLVDRGSA